MASDIETVSTYLVNKGSVDSNQCRDLCDKDPE